MTARETFERLFKAIGEFHRSTVEKGERAIADAKAARFEADSPGGFILVEGNVDQRKADDIKRAHERGDPLPHGARYAGGAVRFRSHRDGQGFTIDGSLRPGQPTREGDEDNGAFIGLRSGHAIEQIRKLKERIDHRMNDLLVENPIGVDDSTTGINMAWDVVRAAFDEILRTGE